MQSAPSRYLLMVSTIGKDGGLPMNLCPAVVRQKNVRVDSGHIVITTLHLSSTIEYNLLTDSEL